MTDVDVVVIGSGAGGLASAVALARAGRKPLVLEQHYAPGGWCHSFQLQGFRFSPGVHYVGDLGPGGPARALFEGLDVARDLVFLELNRQGYEHVNFGGQRFDFPAGRQALSSALAERFPNERKGIEKYLHRVEAVKTQLGGLQDPSVWDLLTVPFWGKDLLMQGFRSFRDVLDSCVRDPALRAFLAVQCGDHGLPPNRAMFGLHAAVAGHYLEGAYYPCGGGAAIAKAYTRGLLRHGGQLRLQTSVERILVEKDADGLPRAIGVRLAGGEEIRARHVISNADPHVTYGKLLEPAHVPPAIRKKLAKTRYSVSALSLFLAVDRDLRAEGFDSGNYWYADSLDADDMWARMMKFDPEASEDFPGMFASVSTLKDPTHFDGRHHTLEVFTFIPFDPFARFEGTTVDARPAEYERLKAHLTARMLRTLEKQLPGISRSVVMSSLGTPITNLHYVRATQGCVYGTEKTRDQLGPFAFQTHSGLRGLTLCGASIMGHGVMGASGSGLAAAAKVLGCKSSELLQKPDGSLQIYPSDDVSAWPERLARRVGSLRVRKIDPGAPSEVAPAGVS